MTTTPSTPEPAPYAPHPTPTPDVESARTDLLAALGGVGVTEVWTTDEMRELFSVESFLAPFVLVRRKSDGARGTLQFQASPRFYHSWVAEL